MKEVQKVYGLHAVKTLLETHANTIQQLFVLQDRLDQRMREVIQLGEKKQIAIQFLSKAQFDKKVGEVNHQGVIALCETKEAMSESALLSAIETQKSILILVLDGVQDPHNLGACLRSANALGVAAVVIPKDRAASVTDVVKKVACGAAEHTPVIAVTNLHRFLAQMKERGVWLVGLDARGDQLISQVDLKGKIAIVMGSEGDGMRRLTKEACDYLAKIPMKGIVESFNVSVATGIVLYEAARQQLKG